MVSSSSMGTQRAPGMCPPAKGSRPRVSSSAKSNVPPSTARNTSFRCLSVELVNKVVEVRANLVSCESHGCLLNECLTFIISITILRQPREQNLTIGRLALSEGDEL